MRVLLVDDNEDDRRWIARLLRDAAFLDHSVEEADCLEQAITLITAQPFDLCIVDWELPDGAGIELAQHPQLIGGHLPVIVITGNERPQQGTFAVGHGAADFLPKDDLTPRTLVRACSHALARSHLEREIDALRKAEQAAAEREHEARVVAEASLVEERRARERVTALHALSVRLGAATTSREVAESVVQGLALLGPAAAAAIHLQRDDVLQLSAATGWSDAWLASMGCLPLTESSPLTDTLRHVVGRVLDPAICERKRGIAVPLVTSSARIGVLTVCYPEQSEPAPDELPYLELVAQHVAQALHRSRLYEEAQQQAEFEERLLSVVGHDLRTPLSAIGMTGTLLRARGVDPELVARLERSTQRMTELITDVLDRAAVRRGVPTQRKAQTAELEPLLHDQVDELRAALPHCQIQLEVCGPVQVRCEPSRTSQIISNLVRNAVQHGLPGAPVAVKLAAHAVGAEISVHNLGSAIPPEELPHLFDPFKRGRRAAGSGTGLGLFIVHESALALGGEVKVTSGASGTTFSVFLPAWPGTTSSTPDAGQGADSR
ncbi:MAG: ATP-binding protein [Polyangiales bacterium]